MREWRFLTRERLRAYFTGPRRAAWIAALAALCLLTVLWWGFHQWFRQKLLTETRVHIMNELEPYGDALSRTTSRLFGLLSGLKAFVEIHISEPAFHQEFEHFAAGLYEGEQGIRNFALLPGGVVRYVYPLANNEEALGHDPLRDPRPQVRADIERALQSGRITLSGPYELVQGGLGLVVRQAVYQGETLWGLVAMVIDVRPILEAVGIKPDTRHLRLALREDSGQVFFGDIDLFEEEPVLYTVALPEGSWELAAVPSIGWEASIRKDLALFDAGALAIVLLLSALTYLITNRNARLAARVEERTREIAAINEELSRARNELEIRVQERTAALQTEVAERRRAEEETRLLLTLTRAISESEDFHTALEVTLQKICQATGWQLGEAWIPRPDGTAIELGPACYGRGEEVRLFHASSKGLVFLPGDGLPGEVWTSKKSGWLRDISTVRASPRIDLIERAGLKAAFAVPIIAGGQVLAVAEFFMREPREEDKHLVEVISTIAGQLASAVEHKLAEEALRESEERLQAIIDNSTAVIYLKDTEGRYRLINRQFEGFFHVSRRGVLDKTDYDFFPKEMAETLRANDREVVEARRALEFEEVVVQDDGEHTYISLKFPMIDASGRIYGVCGVSTDISERKRMEDQQIAGRKRAEGWLQTLIETTQDAVVSIDRQCRIVLFNPAAEKIFGYRWPEVKGKKIGLLMADPYPCESDSDVTQYEESGEQLAVGRVRTVQARRKNGEIFPIEIAITEVTTDQEVRYAAFIRDISEKIRLQQKLIESERLAAIGTTAAKLAHEIANPLNGMSMTVQLLGRRLAKHREVLEESVHSAVRNLMGEINRLANLLNDFRSLSRQEKYNFQPISLAALTSEVLEMENAHHHELGISVEQSFPRDLPPLFADRDKLKQALLNLCKNAVEAMPRGGTLTVRAQASNGQVVLEIADTGVGIPPETDIFEPFFTTKDHGTGLGLVVARRIISGHGGTLTYKSEPGRGTVFQLTLSAAPL